MTNKWASPEEGVVRSQLVPAHQQLGLGVAEEAAHVGACRALEEIGS